MKKTDIYQELSSNAYPGRGIIIGRSADGKMPLLRILLWAEAPTAETGSL